MTPDDFAAILTGADYDNIPDCCDQCLCDLPHRPTVNLAPLLLDLWRACVEFDDQWLMEDSTERRIKDALAALDDVRVPTRVPTEPEK